MQFSRVSNNGYGSSRTPLDNNDLIMMDKSLLRTAKVLKPSIKKPWDFETDKRDKLEMMWYHAVAFRDSMLIEFHAEQSYYIDWGGEAATDEQLRDVVIGSYKHLQHSFSLHLEEYVILPAIADISDDTIQRTVHQLRELFPVQ